MKSRKGAVVCRKLRKTPSPFPASQTGRAVFPHPAFPQVFTAQSTQIQRFPLLSLCRCTSPAATVSVLTCQACANRLAPEPTLAFEADLTKALSLHRSYPVSTLLWASLTPPARFPRSVPQLALRPGW